jgi:Mn-containing catalase
MPARLNRRRYREAVAALKELISNPKTPPQRKLRAIETLLGIYDRHDRTEAARESRKRSAEGPSSPATGEPQGQQPPAPLSPEDALEQARKYLQRTKAEQIDADRQ